MIVALSVGSESSQPPESCGMRISSLRIYPLRSRENLKSSPATSILDSAKPSVTRGRLLEPLGTPSSSAAHDLLARRGQAVGERRDVLGMCYRSGLARRVPRNGSATSF